jgi:hypothetical protein
VAVTWQVFGRADDQRREVVDGGGGGGDRACPGGGEDWEGFSFTAAARLDEMVAAEDVAGGADRVEGVAVAGAAPWWAFGPADLDDAFAPSDQECGESGAVAAGSLDRPAAPLWQVMVGEPKQSPIAAGVGEGFGATQGRPDGGDRCGGESVAVGVDANDAVNGCGQRGQRAARSTSSPTGRPMSFG